jgi:GxxExxY protein
VELDAGFRIDLMVEGRVIVEVKSVREIAPVHRAQLLTYLRLAEVPVGLLLNFDVVQMKDGIVRMVHGFEG